MTLFSDRIGTGTIGVAVATLTGLIAVAAELALCILPGREATAASDCTPAPLAGVARPMEFGLFVLPVGAAGAGAPLVASLSAVFEREAWVVAATFAGTVEIVTTGFMTGECEPVADTSEGRSVATTWVRGATSISGALTAAGAGIQV